MFLMQCINSSRFLRGENLVICLLSEDETLSESIGRQSPSRPSWRKFQGTKFAPPRGAHAISAIDVELKK